MLIIISLCFIKPEPSYQKLTIERDSLKLEDILITIKTCSQNNKKRLKVIAQTWYQFARNQVYLKLLYVI